MTEKKIRCDACGATPALAVQYDHNRVSDAAGGMDLEYKTKDLCALHMYVWLQNFLYDRRGEVSIQEKKKQFSDAAIGWNWKPGEEE